MILQTVAPVAGANAIKSVSFALEWQEPLTEDVITLLVAMHAKVKDALPRVLQRRGAMLKIDLSAEAGITPEIPSTESQLVGATFEALKPNGETAWSLVIDRHFLSVNCGVYTRWNEIWGKARGLMQPFLPVLTKTVRIQAIGLQYIDQFRIGANPADIPADQLFRRDSKLLPGNVFDLNDLWHAHHGFFERLESPSTHRRLNNVNVDVVLMGMEHIIQLTTSHRALLDHPLDEISMALGTDRAGELDLQLNELHIKNKAFLKELLTPEMCRRIGLENA